MRAARQERLMINLQIKRVENVTVVEVAGRAADADADVLQEALLNEIERGNTNLVLDLSGVDFIDSAGLRALVFAYKQVKRIAGDMRLAQPSYPVQTILQLTGLVSIFHIFPTQGDAVNSY
jgi:anti-anti-sigma factor